MGAHTCSSSGRAVVGAAVVADEVDSGDALLVASAVGVDERSVTVAAGSDDVGEVASSTTEHAAMTMATALAVIIKRLMHIEDSRYALGPGRRASQRYNGRAPCSRV
jgi:hypothetical protein